MFDHIIDAYCFFYNKKENEFPQCVCILLTVLECPEHFLLFLRTGSGDSCICFNYRLFIFSNMYNF